MQYRKFSVNDVYGVRGWKVSCKPAGTAINQLVLDKQEASHEHENVLMLTNNLSKALMGSNHPLT